MSWIKIEHVLPDKPEVVRMADVLSLDQDAVVGKLIRFWSWVDQNFEDGNDVSVTKSFLDRYVYCPGFSDALLSVGWLQARSGSFVIPRFSRHNGQSAKSRALTKERVSDKRERELKSNDNSVTLNQKCNAESVTKSLPDKIREEKNRNTEKTVTARAPGPMDFDSFIPEALKTETFVPLWHLWVSHRSKKKKPLSESSAQIQLEDLGAIGLERSLAALRYSLKNGYQGIYEPDPPNTGQQKPIQNQVDWTKKQEAF